jgi:hypothetical protein
MLKCPLRNDFWDWLKNVFKMVVATLSNRCETCRSTTLMHP